MPELPDVEIFRRHLEANARRRRIVRVAVRDRRVLAVAPAALRRRLRDRRIEAGHRYGKYLFGELDDGASLVLYFGMTGRLDYASDGAPPARHDSVVLHLDNDHRLSYYSQRKLGRMALADDRSAFIEEKRLGPDALALGAADFRACWRRSEP